MKIVDNGEGGGAHSEDINQSDDLESRPSKQSNTEPANKHIDDNGYTRQSAYDTTESDVISKTRKELESYDDLDV